MMLSKEYSFSEIVRNSQQAIEYMPRVRLTHDGSRWRLYADGVPVHLEPKPRPLRLAVSSHEARPGDARLLRSNGGIAIVSRYNASSVSTILSGEDNRLRRSQPIGPTLLTGGGRSGWGICGSAMT